MERPENNRQDQTARTFAERSNRRRGKLSGEECASAIQFDVVSRYNNLERRMTRQELPVMIIVQADELEFDNHRQGMDLVMVIDVSGSMTGTKIDLVKETLFFIIGELAEKDRLCLIKFDHKAKTLFNLISMTSDNKAMARDIVEKEIRADGRTDLLAGLESAFKVLLDREQVNELSSIMFLSDGKDTNGNRNKDIQNAISQWDAQMAKKNMAYGISCFGYGQYHDEEVLCHISNATNGSFFYIRDFKLVDDCFIECLSKLMTSFAHHATIRVKLGDDMVYSHKYGPNWDGNDENRLSVGSIYSEMKKNYLFKINIPAIKEDEDKIKLLNVTLNFTINGKHYEKRAELVLDLVDFDYELGKVNCEVEENLHRLEAAEVARQVRREYRHGNWAQAETKMHSFKIRSTQNQHLSMDYKNKITDIFSKDNMNDQRYSKQVEEMMIKQEYRPGYAFVDTKSKKSQQLYHRRMNK